MRSTPPSLFDEKKSVPESSLQNLPLDLKNTIKLFIDMISLSKFFLKQSTKLSIEAADSLIAEIVSLGKKQGSHYVALVKADLFLPLGLTHEDRDLLLQLGSRKPFKQGEYIPYYMKREKIHHYIDQHVNERYQERFKQIIDEACKLTIAGFGSYNLLALRQAIDKNQLFLLPVFDPHQLITTKKSHIVALLKEILPLESVTSSEGNAVKEIISDIDQIYIAFEHMDSTFIRKKFKDREQILKSLIPALLKTSIPLHNLELEINTRNITTMERIKKSKEQLLLEIDEQEIKQAYVIAEIVSDKNVLETRAVNAEKQVQELNHMHHVAIKEAETIQHSLEADNQQLKNKLNYANDIAEDINKSLTHVKRKFQWLYYGLALLGIIIGTVLCVSGIGLIAGAPILGISTLVLGGLMLLMDMSFIGYHIYRSCKGDAPTAPSASAEEITRIPTQRISFPPLPKKAPDDTVLLSTKSLHRPLLSNTDKEEIKPVHHSLNMHN